MFVSGRVSVLHALDVCLVRCDGSDGSITASAGSAEPVSSDPGVGTRKHQRPEGLGSRSGISGVVVLLVQKVLEMKEHQSWTQQQQNTWTGRLKVGYPDGVQLHH